MPYYDSHAFKRPVALLTAGIPTYLFGSWPMDKSPTKMRVSQVALTSNVATVTGTIFEGDIPVVGALIYIDGTVTASGAFNVQGVALTAVSITASTGQGTVSFDLTHANVTATADAGLAIIPQPESSEVIADGNSVPCTIPFNDPRTAGDRTVDITVTYPSIPTACVVNLQTALEDVDAQYQDFGSTAVSTVSGGAVTQYNTQFTLNMSRFYRLNISGLSGTGTIVAKIQA